MINIIREKNVVVLTEPNSNYDERHKTKMHM